MPTIDAAPLHAMLSQGAAQLVEVLPAEEYDWAHLPGALNIPLKAFASDALAGLDPDRPVVVYCHDFL